MDILQATKQLIAYHGVACTLKSITEGTYDPETGSVTNTETSSTITAYPKRITANQFNYPNLINKTVIQFLVYAGELSAKPQAMDIIVMNSENYTVIETIDIVAYGTSALYKITTVKA